MEAVGSFELGWFGDLVGEDENRSWDDFFSVEKYWFIVFMCLFFGWLSLLVFFLGVVFFFPVSAVNTTTGWQKMGSQPGGR